MNQKVSLFTIGIVTLVISGVSLQMACSTPEKKEEVLVKNETTKSEQIARGQYLAIGCNDCHSPKIFSPNGMSFDSSKLFSGHPAGSPLPPVDKKALQPGNWMLFAGDITAYVGPWGMSFAANLTPDSTTGIGAWSEETFIKTLRTGKHLGLDGGRPIMPPMPWEVIGKMTDDDLKALYAYFQSIPAVKNQVPAYIPPTEVAKMP